MGTLEFVKFTPCCAAAFGCGKTVTVGVARVLHGAGATGALRTGNNGEAGGFGRRWQAGGRYNPAKGAKRRWQGGRGAPAHGLARVGAAKPLAALYGPFLGGLHRGR